MDSKADKATLATPSATRSASAPVTPIASASPSPASSPARARWSDEEGAALDIIVAQQQGITTDWTAVAQRLGELCSPPEGQTARTSKQCYDKWKSLRNASEPFWLI